MRHVLLTLCFLVITIHVSSQNITNESLMGEWEVLNVNIPNAEDIPQKKAIKFMEDAFLGSSFNFKGNHLFKLTYSKKADDRIEELFKLDKTNWTIEDNVIKIGTKADSFSAMSLTYKEEDNKVYFVLPVMVLEMKKLSDAKPSKAKWIKGKAEKKGKTPIDYSKIELIEKDIDDSLIIDFKDAEHPPLAPDCDANWSSEKKRECTSRYIIKHVNRKFDLSLLRDIKQTGTIRVIVSFIIDTEGKPINIEAEGGPEVLNDHIKKVVAVIPNLEPATLDGEPINIAYKMPFVLQIQE